MKYQYRVETMDKQPYILEWFNSRKAAIDMAVMLAVSIGKPYRVVRIGPGTRFQEMGIFTGM